MIKKLTYVLFAMIFVGNATAVPSIKKLGNNVSASTVAVTPTATPSKQPAAKSNAAITVKSAKTPTIKNEIKSDSTRLPAITALKTIKAVSGSTIVKPADSTQPNTAGVSTETFDAAIQRIDALEAQSAKAITEVDDGNQSGNYVTDVAIDGNKLNVTKSNILVAPIKNSAGEPTSGNAEIWIIK